MATKRRYDETGYIYNLEYSNSRRQLSNIFQDRRLTTARRPTSWVITGVNTYYIVEDGDTYHSIALKIYNDARCWWYLADFNPTVDFNALTQGTQLIVPVLDSGGY